uniref:6-pyruvoyl-tetrahydropterin synthase n=1 Tax=Streptomyces auratus AGR0001 TaxID=1160718 RepID=J2K6A4_9ACTN
MMQDLRQEVLGAFAARVVEELVRLGLFDDAAVRHEDDPVRRGAREPHLMGDHDHRHAVPGELLHDVQHLIDHLRVQRGGRLVEQHHLRVHRQRAGYRHALLLTAGELCGVLVRLGADTDPVEQRAGLLRRCRLVGPADLGLPQHHVLEHRLVREEVERLEDHADIGAQPGQLAALLRQRLPVDRDAAGVDGLQAVDRAAERRLARARGPDHDDDLTAVDRQVDVLEHVQRAEVLVHVVQHDQPVRCGRRTPGVLGHRYFAHRRVAPSSSIGEDPSNALRPASLVLSEA